MRLIAFKANAGLCLLGMYDTAPSLLLSIGGGGAAFLIVLV